MNLSHSRKNRFFLSMSVFFLWFSVYTYPSFFSAYVANKLMAPEVMTGLIVGSYGFMQMLLRIPVGILSDLLKKRKLFVMLGFAASILGSALLILIDRTVPGVEIPGWVHWMALIARGLAGVGVSSWVTLSVLYSSGYTKEELPAANSRLMVPQYGSQVLAMLLGAQLAEHFGETSAFILALAGSALGLLFTGLIHEDVPDTEPIRLRDIPVVLKNRDLICGTTLGILLRIICWCTVLGFLPNWAENYLHCTTAQLGTLSVIYLLPTTIVARLSGDMLLKRFSMSTILAAGFGLMGISCLLYPHITSYAALLVAQVLFGCGMGLILPLTLSIVIRSIPTPKRGVAMGTYQALYGAGMFIGPVIAGWIISAAMTEKTGYIINFYANAGVSAVGALLSILLFRQKKVNK